MKETINQEG